MLNEIKFPHISKSSPRYKRYVINNSIYERFLDKIEKTNKCWRWIGSKRVQKDPLNNYGQFAVNKKIYGAHRISWMLFKGRIPKGKQVLHTCDNIICVKPSHLYLGTPADNSRDKVRRGRSTKGIDHPHSILSEEDVIFIKKNTKNMRIFKIAEHLKVPFNTVWCVVHNRTWKHITI